ncbi:nitroreductase family deazaflavin-dependent oxidoreductase [Prauserella cavernicola]|uniref:Nitroreductase family deazaflavin-dependent oxidoreductase n=1 Tax=Prauserella cavernicola TaxID=2800127 RepID=A0A934V4V4_9PSEU|nr:nitroreductase family deazaflavin-dependent oxidoreductase [Prauserella cavernicola]MBK1785802.1 nitroreductase family deazaflavin-dependent oxidoreductase [Prauserella cavernicola]
MPLPQGLARFNRVVTNRIARTGAGRLPGFGILVHRGRRSGRTYRTPLNVFRVRGGFVIALTYGPGTDWVRNVLAEGHCELETRGRTVRLVRPRVVHDERRGAIPQPARTVLGALNVHDLLYLAEDS